MAVLSWGKPAIYIKKDGESAFTKLPDAVEGTVTLATTKGSKTEAKVEGGENEDVRYQKNTYVLNVTIRVAKGRKAPIEDNDGIIDGNFELYLQPEDPACVGFYMPKSTCSVEDSWSSADGGQWAYAFDALKPATGNQVQWGVVTVSEGTPSIAPVA